MRFYDPYLNHFLQPDSIIPNLANPQSLNRFSYVGNNPINHNDPTGHKWVCIGVNEDHCSDDGIGPVSGMATYVKKPTKKDNDGGNPNMILICGDDMFDSVVFGACTPHPALLKFSYEAAHYPGNLQPLSPAAVWAQANNIPTTTFSTGSCYRIASCLDWLRGQIVQFMLANNSPIIIVGFSGGAPFSTGIATEAIKQGFSPSLIQLVQLDSAINPSRNSQSAIDSLVKQGVKVNIFNSQDYQNYNDSNPPYIEIPKQSVLTSAITHQQLAVDQGIFDQYIAPILP